MLGAASSMGGGGGGEGGGGGGPIEFHAEEYANIANSILDKALTMAIPYSEKATQFGIEALKNFYQQSRNDTFDYENKARIDLLDYESKARNDYQKNFDIAQAKLEPYVQAGYGALDTYQDMLGLSRPGAGAAAMAQGRELKAGRDAARRELQQQGSKLMASLPDLSPSDRTNLAAMINTGGNPAHILEALQQIGITQGSTSRPQTSARSKYEAPNSFENPQLSTFGIQAIPTSYFGADGQLLPGTNLDPISGAPYSMGSGGMGGGGGHMSAIDSGQPIPSILGDIMNSLANFNNRLYNDYSSGVYDFNNYLMPASQSYQSYLQNTIPSNMQPILAALRSGSTGQGAIPTDVYRRY